MPNLIALRWKILRLAHPIATQIVADAYQDNCDLTIVVSADSDMIPAIELAIEAGHKVVVYIPPYQYSSNLASMASSKPVQLKQYESRFKQCILPDVVHLTIPDFDLNIPPKWKGFQDWIVLRRLLRKGYICGCRLAQMAVHGLEKFGMNM